MMHHLSQCLDDNGGETVEIMEAIDEGIITHESPTEEAQIPQEEEERPILAPLAPEGTPTCCTEEHIPHSPGGEYLVQNLLALAS